MHGHSLDYAIYMYFNIAQKRQPGILALLCCMGLKTFEESQH